MDSIKEWLAAYKAKTGSTDTQIAKALKISRTGLYHKTKGDSELSMTEAKRLATVLGIPLETLATSPFELTRN